MPKRPRGARKKSASNLTEDQAMYLMAGLCLDGHRPDYHHPRMGGLLPRDCPFADPAAMAQAWAENRDHLMAQAKPGERPWGWWRHDAPEPRRRTPMLYGYHPDGGHSYYPIGTIGVFGAKPTEQEETEADYLTRLDLWMPGELEAWQSKR